MTSFIYSQFENEGGRKEGKRGVLSKAIPTTDRWQMLMTNTVHIQSFPLLLIEGITHNTAQIILRQIVF